MVKSEEEIRNRIKELESNLKRNETIYGTFPDEFSNRRILIQSFNIESQLYALYDVLGEKYKYKHM